MPSLRYVAFVASLALTSCWVNADEAKTPDKEKPHQRWLGSWQVSGDLNRILGFATNESRADAVTDHPSSFHISLDKRIGEKMLPLKLRVLREQVFKRLDHRIVATGKWTSTFEPDNDPGVGSDCYITESGGRTFLFCDAPYVVIYGGAVSFLKGVDREHDLLVIDFNLTQAHLAGKQRTPDTVAYKRAAK